MKSPRTLLNELEEAGCRLAQIPGIRGGHLLLSEDPKINQELARAIRALDWPPLLKEPMFALASRLERRSYPGLVGIDSNGCFMNMKGELCSTPESKAAAACFYDPQQSALSKEESEKAWNDKIRQLINDGV